MEKCATHLVLCIFFNYGIIALNCTAINCTAIKCYFEIYKMLGDTV